jgi:hypothetical protein
MGHAGGGRRFATPLRALVVDRGRDEKGELQPRAFYNMDAMLGLLRKYNVPYDVLDDAHTARMSFVEQARTYGGYGLIIMGHGAAQVNLVFAAARAVLVEITPYGVWCPMYSKMAAAMGLHVLPIFSRLKGPGLDYNYTTRRYTTAEVEEGAARCEALSLVLMQADPCVVDSRVGTIVTPLLEFEHTVVHALELLGRRTFPVNSTLDLLEGVPNGGPGEARWRPGLHTERRAAARALLCRPGGAGAAGGTYMSEGAA